jgi:hypothetical protein
MTILEIKQHEMIHPPTTLPQTVIGMKETKEYKYIWGAVIEHDVHMRVADDSLSLKQPTRIPGVILTSAAIEAFHPLACGDRPWELTGHTQRIYHFVSYTSEGI